ncbi:MAG TPA: hypothetical protein CFH81_08875 [Sulfurovum sp. UBA12169]|nr:MAG TPA: hypothetical protein CFH81_08875 [Sulfurovum sp. UBA12169]
MAKFNTKFDPYVSQVTKPTEGNMFSALAVGLSGFDKAREDTEIREINMDELQKKRRDDKKLAALASYEGPRSAFMRQHGDFETASAAMDAENIFKSRAAQRIAAEQLAQKNSAKTQPKALQAPAIDYGAFGFGKNETAPKEPDQPAATQTPKPSAPKKTVTLVNPKTGEKRVVEIP